MTSEWTFEPCENGTNDPAVHIVNVFSIDIPTFKITKSKIRFFYQEGLHKALSDVMEHQISLRKFSEYNNID